jgi:hypothetical protein
MYKKNFNKIYEFCNNRKLKKFLDQGNASFQKIKECNGH